MQYFLEDLALGMLEILSFSMDRQAHKFVGCALGTLITFSLTFLGMIILAYFLVQLTVR